MDIQNVYKEREFVILCIQYVLFYSQLVFGAAFIFTNHHIWIKVLLLVRNQQDDKITQTIVTSSEYTQYIRSWRY